MDSTDRWESRPGYLMAALGAHVSIRFAELLAPMGLQPPHFGVLRRLSGNEGATQQEMADAMRCRRAAMVTLVDELEELGLVERRRHPVDRRANALHLTPAGRRTMKRVAAAARVLEAELLGAVPGDSRAGFLDGLRHLGVATGVADGVFPMPDDAAQPELIFQEKGL